MKRLAALVIVLTATFAFAGGRDWASKGARVFADDTKMTWANHISSERLRLVQRTYEEPFIYFERGSKAYVITDSAIIDEIRAILAPQVALGQKQAALGTQQAALGSKQAALGMEQARLGIQQASDPQNATLAARQNELGERQARLGEEQARLGEQQSRLGEEQHRLGEEVDRKVEALLDRAMRSGVAKEVRRT